MTPSKRINRNPAEALFEQHKNHNNRREETGPPALKASVTSLTFSAWDAKIEDRITVNGNSRPRNKEPPCPPLMFRTYFLAASPS